METYIKDTVRHEVDDVVLNTIKNTIYQLEDTEKQPTEKQLKTLPLLQFRAITPDTLPLINTLIQDAKSRTCDYTIGGIFMWIDRFAYEYCVYSDTLFIKGVSETDENKTAFSLPIGQLPLEYSVSLIMEYCAYYDIKPLFSAIPEDRLDYLMSITSGTAEELVDWADYLYEAEALAELTGKKYNKKRNHVNRFMTENPNYVFEPLSDALIPEVLLFHTGMSPESEPGHDDSSQYEKEQCTYVLNHYNRYPFEGAVLRDETGEICAYTCGEVIGDTLYIHIEKMNHEIAGSGETINKLYAQYMTHRHPYVRYINREEDCGDEGLRHAKESYNPVMRLRKFNVYA
ncbi:MAG: DUF2156 domain-containing protein [Muribaculaceae bacterium]|nr:DUF2156 domain-containing protein [Muribaculaceae bacterium]